MRLPFDPVYLPPEPADHPATRVSVVPQGLTLDPRRGRLFSLLFKR